MFSEFASNPAIPFSQHSAFFPPLASALLARPALESVDRSANFLGARGKRRRLPASAGGGRLNRSPRTPRCAAKSRPLSRLWSHAASPVAASALLGAFTIHPRATQPLWRDPEPLRYPMRHLVARAAPRCRVCRLHPARLAPIDEGLNLGCAAAPSSHGAPDQLGAISAPHHVATSRAREAL